MRRSFARYACGLFGIACLAALGLVASAASAQAQTITVRNPTVKVNGVEAPTHVVSEPRASIQIDVVSGPGERNDWVGIYRIGAADTAWLDWAYLNGQQTLPATGLHTASFTMTLPIPRGPFELRWFTGSTRLATSATVESEVRTRAAGGDAHTLTVRADGTVWASGLNASGQLGDDSMTTRPRQSRLAG